MERAIAAQEAGAVAVIFSETGTPAGRSLDDAELLRIPTLSLRDDEVQRALELRSGSYVVYEQNPRIDFPKFDQTMSDNSLVRCIKASDIKILPSSENATSMVELLVDQVVDQEKQSKKYIRATVMSRNPNGTFEVRDKSRVKAGKASDRRDQLVLTGDRTGGAEVGELVIVLPGAKQKNGPVKPGGLGLFIQDDKDGNPFKS